MTRGWGWKRENESGWQGDKDAEKNYDKGWSRDLADDQLKILTRRIKGWPEEETVLVQVDNQKKNIILSNDMKEKEEEDD